MKKTIGLVDVDGHNFPNLPLMKISAYHKAMGDSVEQLFGLKKYDKVYMSKVFNFTKDYEEVIMANMIIKGGTGYDVNIRLSNDIENTYPDYSLYGIKDTAYGYLTRGCPRQCKFCIVSQKEGLKSSKVADLKQFWNGQKEIKLLDPNILASEDSDSLLMQLKKSKAYIDFTQGLDIRLMTDDKAKLINNLKIKMIHFAWDNYEFQTYEKLKYFRNFFGLDVRKLRVYVLTNFNTTHEQDLERIYKLQELDYDPYVMIYDKHSAPKNTRRMQRWCNNKFIYRSCNKFENYQKKAV